MAYHNYTPEQIAAMHDRNENFHGKTANLPIKAKLDELLEQCPDVCMVEGYPPNAREQCAIIWIDFKSMAMMDDKASTLLAEVMRMADDAFIRGGKKVLCRRVGSSGGDTACLERHVELVKINHSI